MSYYGTVILSSAALLSGFDTARAADTNKWESSAAAGLTITSGNSDTLLGTLTLNSARKWDRDEILLGAGAAYGEQTVERDVLVSPGVTLKRDHTDTTTASAQGFGQYNHFFTKRFYDGVRLNILHDRIADVKYRITLSPLVGYYVIKNPTTQLAFEAGPSFVAEKQGEEKNEYVALRLAERFEHKLSATAKIWQSIEYIPQIDRWGNYLVTSRSGRKRP